MPIDEKAKAMYLRLVSLKVKPDKIEEFRQIYITESVPTLRSVEGCRFAYLIESTDEKSEFISVTLWNSRKDADNYEKSGLFEKLLNKHKHTFENLFQWKMYLDRNESKKAVTSEDMTVTGYSILTGKRFT